MEIRVDRLQFAGDKPATSKQVPYVISLVEQMQARAAVHASDLVRAVWAVASIPDDLTKREASAVIDAVKWEDYDPERIILRFCDQHELREREDRAWNDGDVYVIALTTLGAAQPIANDWAAMQ
jgi:hypothetical protein